MPRARYDEGWKEAIRGFFPQFMNFFFPDIVQHLTGGHFEKIKGIDNIGLLPIFCQQTMDKGRRLSCCPSPRPMILFRAIFVESSLVCQG